MNSFMSLMNRHNKVFRRDHSVVFFSMLSVVIVVILYAVFIQKSQIDAIKQILPNTVGLQTMVNEWMVGGILSMVTMTTTLAAYGIYIQDTETRRLDDYLTAPITRAKIQLSYVANAWIIGYLLSILAFISCEVFIVTTGGQWLNWIDTLKIAGILALSVTLASAINICVTLLVTSQGAFSTLNTIIGTAIGFLCGVYVPMIALPGVVQKIIILFPISHSALMMRDILMNQSIHTIFKGVPDTAKQYMLNVGVLYKWNDQIISHSTSLLFMAISTIVFALLSISIFTWKNK